jgi:hypothetical protein
MSKKAQVVPQKNLKENKLFDNALLALLFIFVIIFSFSKINGEDDIFWHLSTGKYIIETKSVPSQDVFGFITQGQQWIPFEWGWDVTAYSIFSAADFIGLYIFNVIIIAVIFFLIYLMLRKFKVPLPLSIFYLLILILGVRYRLEIKPNIISYLFLVLTLFLIVNYKYFGKSYKILFFIPPIFMVWANMHMGVLAGVMLLGIYLSSEIILFVKEKKKEGLKYAIIVFAASIIFMLINPNHIMTYIYSFQHTQMKMIDQIYEWMSPFNSNFLGKLFNIIYIIFLAGILVVYADFKKKKDWFEILVYILFAVYSLRAVRFTVDFIFVVSIFLFIAIYHIIKKETTLNLIRNGIYVKLFLLFMLVIFIFSTPNDKLYRALGFQKTFGTGIYEETFPVNMFNFMKENKITEIGERPFNTFDFGGYFIWNFPGKKNFIDSRNLNDSIWNSFITIFTKQTGYQNLINEYRLDYFAIFQTSYLQAAGSGNTNAIPKIFESNIISYLSSKPDEWKLIYWDDKSFLYVKNEDKFKELISKYEYKYFTPYNLCFKGNILQSAMNSKDESLSKEIARKYNEEPKGYFVYLFKTNFDKKK